MVVPESKEEAKEAVEQIVSKRCFGSAGDQVVIEERLEGVEVSLLGTFALCLSLSVFCSECLYMFSIL